MLSHSVLSDSLWTVAHPATVAHPWTVAHPAPLSVWILWARIVEWVAIYSSRGPSQPRDQTHIYNT